VKQRFNTVKILVLVLHAATMHSHSGESQRRLAPPRPEGGCMPDIVSTWMRGGTSKCWVFDRDQLEIPDRSIDDVLLRVFGSPDPRQVDGVGGGTSTTSKAVIVAPAAASDVDVEYTFAQVAVEEARVDWGSNCGNCSSVVGLYAIRRGWVRAQADVTTVRVRNTNTGQLILLQVPTPDGVLDERGRDWIPGVPFPGMGVRMWFVDPAGQTTGSLFPTGSTTDTLTAPAGPVTVTLVDAGAPLVIVPAQAIGLTGTESPSDLDARADLLGLLEDLRRQGAVRMGLAPDKASAERAVPKMALVAAPAADEDADFVVRMLSMGRVHPALAITGSVALTMAAGEPGSVIGQRARFVAGSEVRIMTPAGLVTTWTGEHDGRVSVGVLRTARRLAEATLVLPEDETAPPDRASTPNDLTHVERDGLQDHAEVGSR
jgi:2-methylaconitate cis-trans-isomerase PrpF